MNTPMRYLTPAEVSEITSIKRTTLASWRQKRKGPPYIMVEGTLPRYPKDQFEQWLTQHTVHSD